MDQTAEKEQVRRDAWLVVCRLVPYGVAAWLLHKGVSRILTQISRGESIQKRRRRGIIKAHPYPNQSMPPSRLFLFLANSFTLLPFSQSFLIAPDRQIQLCFPRFKTHTMPLASPSSIVDFVDDNSQNGANVDTRAFPSDPNSSNTGTGQRIKETPDDIIRVAVLGTGMMGQVRFRVCNCWLRWRVCFLTFPFLASQLLPTRG